jgi:photosystem II stability/assembly factor-like uncharacterized protein
MRQLSSFFALSVIGVLFTSCAADRTGQRTAAADMSEADADEDDDGDGASEVPKDWFIAQRAFPGNSIDPVRRYQAFETARSFRANDENVTGSTWSFVGPDNVGGRITDIQSSPSRPETIYVASAAGGVFRSDDHGATMRPLFDGQASLSIGAIGVDPRNADVVWAGTGEANSSGDSYPGTGIYLTRDGGTTWQRMGLEKSQHIGRIVVDPTDSSTVYVATMGSMRVEDNNRGLYRTRDMGATWDQILFTSTRVGAVDVAIDPSNPSNLYAGLWERMRDDVSFKKGGPGSGIFRSTDGGATWTRSSTGLPEPGANSGRVGLSLCAGSPRTLYSIFDDTSAGLAGVYRSDDGAVSWRRVDTQTISGLFSSYGWWFGNVRVSPTNPDHVFALGLSLVHSEDGGRTWTRSGRMHPDNHALLIDPTNPDQIYSGNDGGFHISSDRGVTWTRPVKMPITQFYNIAIDPTNSAKIYGGAQDNGTSRTTTGGASDWQAIYGGDGFQVVVDPVDTNIIYAESQNGGLGRSNDGGNNFSDIAPQPDRANWNTPIRLDPNDHNTVYFGGNRLYRSNNTGTTWNAVSPDLTNGPVATRPGFGTITTLSVSKADSHTVYVGTDDGNVWVTRTNGKDWTKISNSLPHLYVTSVQADTDDAARVWVTYSGFDDEPLGRVFRSDDAGATWRPIGAGLPPVPVNALQRSPRSPDILYVGTDTGVFMTNNAGETWTALGTGMPLVPVLDLVFDRIQGRILAATHGRSIYALSITP